MTDLATIVEIVRTQEANEIRHAVVMTVLMLAVAVPCAVCLVRRFAKVGVAMCLALVGALVLMANKPQVTWDDYLKNDGTEWATNTVGTKTGVMFRWERTDLRLPYTTPLYISKSPTNEENYVRAATTDVGSYSHELSLADPEAYKYIVWHEWVPPSPSHTNGVWLGNVIEKAKGCDGVDKLLIINGQILENGKEIAPCVR